MITAAMRRTCFPTRLPGPSPSAPSWPVLTRPSIATRSRQECGTETAGWDAGYDERRHCRDFVNKRAGEAAPGSLHVSENGSRPVAQTVREHPEILDADATGTGPYDTAAARARLASVERTAATTASVACRSKHGKARERITLGLRRDNPERRACHLRRNGNAPCGRREARLRVIRITHSPTRADTRARFEPRAKSPAPDLHVTQQLRPSVPHHHLG